MRDDVGSASRATNMVGRPQDLVHYISHVDYCRDVLYLTAVDDKGAGVAIVAPLEETTSLSRHEAERWQMLAAHIETGHRLRQGLARGRWSMIDWFDSDESRFVLAVPNAPHIENPRGLTERESQVVSLAALGHTNKMIAYRLGLSKTRVSTVLRTAMKNLGFRTRGQLVKYLRDFAALE